MLELTIAFSRNPRLLPLIDGTVGPQNVKLNFVESHPAELFYRNLKYDEFDVTEMSISDFLIARERRDAGRWQWAALPIFFLKAFYLWPAMYVSAESGIKSPADLKGKRVGVPDYQMTAALWIRVVLNELYGIQPSDITWYNGRTKEVSHGAMLGLYKDPPPGVTLNWLDESQTFDRMLDEGQIDAATGFYPRRSGAGQNFIDIDRYGGTRMEGNPRIRKLLSDGGREIIVEYYGKAGIIPVNHMVVVQERILAQHPWLALEIYKAFRRSKEVAFERAREIGAGYLLFADHSFQEQANIFGEDPYLQGVRANRKMLEVLFQGSFEQGLTKKLARVEEVFYPTTLDT
jgi:4,5-dihydroxyphthalate decarboxylase